MAAEGTEEAEDDDARGLFLSQQVRVEEWMETLMSWWKCLFVQSGLRNYFLMADVLRSQLLITSGHRSAGF